MNGDLFLKETRRLHDRGFAIHWLRPREKRPAESGWTTGPRKTWDELRRSYVPGYNVGVRLGTPSKMKNGYLAVLDVDIKNPTFAKEAIIYARKLIGNSRCSIVRSGRGNGSRHFYFVTRAPFKTFDPKKIKGAWECSFYSDGRQVVLPPSIHPETGKEYEWGARYEELPVIDVEKYRRPMQMAPESGGMRKELVQDFQAVPVNLARVLKSKNIRKAIVSGEGVTDRSAYLLFAANALRSAGLNRNQILSVLTNPKYFLGQTAYRHANTKSQTVAANWVEKYTLQKMYDDRSAKRLLDSIPFTREKNISPEEAKKQEKELGETPTSETGYYSISKTGKLKPDFDALLKAFEVRSTYRTIADMKAVYSFNGTHYVESTPIEIKAFSENVMEPKPEEKIRAEFYSKVLANRVTRRSFFTESIEGKVNFKNGVLDLSVNSGALLPHSGDFGFRGVLPYDFDPGATCPLFKKWLNGVMLGDLALTSILQEFMGYVVRGGDYKYHKALWLGGVGRNGKSTFVDILKALIGVGNYTTLSIRSLIGDKFAGSELDGKLANFSEETSPQELADSGPFKNLTGDGELIVQKKYGDLYPMRNKAKLIMTYNQIPDIKDLSKGMLSRPLIVPFEKEISEKEQDKNIKNKLFTEMPGIFNFALEGWHRLEENGNFTNSARSGLALKAMKEESCSVFQWVENCIEISDENFYDKDDGESYRPATLYAHYLRSNSYPFRYIEFCRRLADHPKMKAKKSTSKGKTIYHKIRLASG